MPKNSSSSSRAKHDAHSKTGAAYNEFKEYEGQRYTGMKIGRSHKWYYDKGEWKETKITPDLWQVTYNVTKRRAGHAPEGSGVPVGTQYHWYVLAHQNAIKQNANDYALTLTGLKFKIAHKRAGSEKWIPDRSIRAGPPSYSWRTLMFSMNKAATISMSLRLLIVSPSATLSPERRRRALLAVGSLMRRQPSPRFRHAQEGVHSAPWR